MGGVTDHDWDQVRCSSSRALRNVRQPLTVSNENDDGLAKPLSQCGAVFPSRGGEAERRASADKSGRVTPRP